MPKLHACVDLQQMCFASSRRVRTVIYANVTVDPARFSALCFSLYLLFIFAKKQKKNNLGYRHLEPVRKSPEVMKLCHMSRLDVYTFKVSTRDQLRK